LLTIIAHQYLHQLELVIRHAVLGNAGTIMAFRVGAEDAFFLSRELDATFSPSDLVSAPNWQCATKLMVDGVPTKAFSARTMPIPSHTISPQHS
jgi:hypothetical protein